MILDLENFGGGPVKKTPCISYIHHRQQIQISTDGETSKLVYDCMTHPKAHPAYKDHQTTGEEVAPDVERHLKEIE